MDIRLSTLAWHGLVIVEILPTCVSDEATFLCRILSDIDVRYEEPQRAVDASSSFTIDCCTAQRSYATET